MGGCLAREGDDILVGAEVLGGGGRYGVGAGDYGGEVSVPERGEVEPLVGV